MEREKRQSERIDAQIEIQFRNGAEYIACYTKNISRGGIYLETETLPDPNAIVELVFDLNTDLGIQKTISLRAKIARLMTTASDGKTIHKVGLQFIDVSPQTQIQLDSLYNTLAHKAQA